MQRRSVLAAGAALLAAPALAASADAFDGDPFKSLQWPALKKEFLGARARVVFDARVRVRVRVLGPAFAEDAMNVPISVVADLPAVQRLLTFELASENPVFSFDFAKPPLGPLRIVGVDNNGNRIDTTVE